MRKANPTARNTGLYKNYVPNWDLWDALRELLQNHMDGCVDICGSRDRLLIDTEYENSFRFYNGAITDETLIGEIIYDPVTLQLEIWNQGRICTKNLLLGGTLKIGNKEAIGIHGEGQKLAALVLCREGHSVACLSGTDRWQYSIDADFFYTDPEGQPCECLFINKVACDIGNKVALRIGGVSSELWIDTKKKALWLTPESDIGRITTPHGDLLLEDYYQTKVFVKELFICSYPYFPETRETPTSLNFGYNFFDVPLNRDRKAIEDLSIRHKRTSAVISWILNHFHSHQGQLVKKLAPLTTDKFVQTFLKSCCKGIEGSCNEFYNVGHGTNANNQIFGVDKNGADRIWDTWKQLHKHEASLMPIYHSELQTVPAFIRDRALPDTFYPTVAVGWLANGVLKKSSRYQSVSSLYAQLKDHPAVDPIPTNILPVLQRSIEKIQRLRPEFELKHLKFQNGVPPNVHYLDGNVACFSETLLQDPELREKLVGLCLKMLKVDYLEIAKLL